MNTSAIQVECDLTQIQGQVEGAKKLLECLPETVQNRLLESFANLGDLGLETETVPAIGACGYILRFRSVALADLCSAARGALNIDCS